MAKIKPIRGLRYTDKAGGLAGLLCPPFEEISGEERERLMEENPFHAGRLEDNADAASLLKSWLSDGILTQSKNDTLYIYEEEFVRNREHIKNKGLLCLVKPENGGHDIIFPYENRQEKQNISSEKTEMQFIPVYALYEDTERETHTRIERLSMDTPRYECAVGGVTHRLWAVNDRIAIRAFQEDFAPRRLWIADEENRVESAVPHREQAQEITETNTDAENIIFFLVRADADGLLALAQHRMVRGITEFQAETVLEKCGECFDIYIMEDTNMIGYTLDALYRQWQKAFAFYAGGQSWYLLRLKGGVPPKDFLAEELEEYRMLDTVLLRGLILEPVLGIAEERAGRENVCYERKLEKALEAVQNGEQQCAFFMNPARPAEMLRVTEAGRKVPRKAAVFYPKPASGFVFCSSESRSE